MRMFLFAVALLFTLSAPVAEAQACKGKGLLRRIGKAASAPARILRGRSGRSC